METDQDNPLKQKETRKMQESISFTGRTKANTGIRQKAKMGPPHKAWTHKAPSV